MSDVAEVVLNNAENWKLEAQAVVGDIKNHVKNIAVSDNLTSTNQKIYFNLETLEGNRFCVELSGSGFRVVGEEYDTADLSDRENFETPYSLLSTISPSFSTSFGNELTRKLEELTKE